MEDLPVGESGPMAEKRYRNKDADDRKNIQETMEGRWSCVNRPFTAVSN